MPKCVRWERNARLMANKSAGANFQGKWRCKKIQYYRGVKLLEHAMKIVERVLDKKIQESVDIDSMQFGFMRGRRTTDTLFVV